MPEVQVKDIDKMNLLGLFIIPLLNRNLQNPQTYKRIKKLNCSVVIAAGRRMKVTLIFRKGEVFLERGAIEKPTASIEGSLEAFINAGLGNNLFRMLLTRKIKIRGNPFVLLPLRALMKVTSET